MKDNIEILLEKAFPANMLPPEELNANIIDAKTDRKPMKRSNGFVKAAIILLVAFAISPAVVYATSNFFDKVFVTKRTISVGNPDYVVDEYIAATEEVKVEEKGYEEGTANDKWHTKKVEVVNGFATNTYYTYEDYETALSDSKLKNMFSKSYEEVDVVTYVISETSDTQEYSISAFFKYGNGTFHTNQSLYEGNIAEDAAHSVLLENAGNVRTYTATTGEEYTLVDEVTKEDGQEIVKTYVWLAYGSYTELLMFRDLTEQEIHEVLDTVNVMKTVHE